MAFLGNFIKAHVALEHIPRLRQFVKAGGAQKSTE